MASTFNNNSAYHRIIFNYSTSISWYIQAKTQAWRPCKLGICASFSIVVRLSRTYVKNGHTEAGWAMRPRWRAFRIIRFISRLLNFQSIDARGRVRSCSTSCMLCSDEVRLFCPRCSGHTNHNDLYSFLYRYRIGYIWSRSNVRTESRNFRNSTLASAHERIHDIGRYARFFCSKCARVRYLDEIDHDICDMARMNYIRRSRGHNLSSNVCI